MSVAPNARARAIRIGVSAEHDDPLGAKATCGNHPAQPDGAVADHRHDLSGLYSRSASGMVAGAHHVCQREQ
jgi:hypothetical protein